MCKPTKSKGSNAAVVSSRVFKGLLCSAVVLAFCVTGLGGGWGSDLPKEIRAIMDKPRYSGATWGLRVVNMKSGAVIYDFNSQEELLTGSVRKLYSVGVTLNELGADHRFKTPVFRRGEVDNNGDLTGDLILVAKGDLRIIRVFMSHLLLGPHSVRVAAG